MSEKMDYDGVDFDKRDYKNASIFPSIKRDALIAFRAEHGDEKTALHVAGLALKSQENRLDLSSHLSQGTDHSIIDGFHIHKYLKTTDNRLIYRGYFEPVVGKGQTSRESFACAVDKLIGVDAETMTDTYDPWMENGDVNVSVISIASGHLIIEP